VLVFVKVPVGEERGRKDRRPSFEHAPSCQIGSFWAKKTGK
jgi:hypothetical protein